MMHSVLSKKMGIPISLSVVPRRKMGVVMSNCVGSTYVFCVGISYFYSYCKNVTTWWFQIFFIFTPTWGRFPF